MSKAIVVGINGSAGSDAALAWALDRAARDKLPVIVVHAVDDRWMSPDFQYHEIIRESGMELLREAQASAREQAPDVKWTSSFVMAAAARCCGRSPRRQPWWWSAAMTNIGWTAVP